MKRESRNRLSHIPCQQPAGNSAPCGTYSTVCGNTTMAVSGTNESSSAMTAELVGQHSSLAPAWPGGGSAALTGGPQTDFSSSLEPATASSQSAAFHCVQNAPLSGLSHPADLQSPSQPFAGYHDGAAQLQNHSSPSANSSVRCSFTSHLLCIISSCHHFHFNKCPQTSNPLASIGGHLP